ncbi:MAG: isocitrate lyase/phosphoenolpyruvate mutase family protein [Rhodobacteraceae bacterium]|nr:isocitrate lyase/phosphoenolpyruvate mutase family protein [Paracoccaceae bacterium]
MNTTRQAEIAAAFRARHHAARGNGARPLVLPNVWDAMSARLFAGAGFDALATTSGGVAWALGHPDGEAAPWPEVVAATARIVRAAGVPVSADIEAGYGATPEEVGAHVAEIIATGVAGINLEDGHKGALRATDDAAARIAAARAAADASGVPIVINARCDVFLHGKTPAAEAHAIAVERGRAYLAAGADCVYPIGLRAPDAIAAFVRAIDAPVNVTGRPGMPDAAALGRAGVARITLATLPALVTMAAIRQLATDLRAQGGFDPLAATITHPDAQALFQAKR